MKLEIDTCSQCDCGKKRPIVNKHFYLCESKNKERLQMQKVQVQRSSGGGEVKESRRINPERKKFKGVSRVREGKEERNRRDTEKWQSRFVSVYGKGKNGNNRLRSKKAIRKVSTNKFKCSNGELITQEEIEVKYRAICLVIDNERDKYCEATGRTDLPLSHSHTISQRRCKNLGKTELIWDKDNIYLESMGASDSGHYTWEHLPLAEKKKLINFDKKLEYIKQHDEELYQKLVQG